MISLTNRRLARTPLCDYGVYLLVRIGSLTEADHLEMPRVAFDPEDILLELV